MSGQTLKNLSAFQDEVLLADLFSESESGGTNVAAALGNGRLSVGISPWAELVYLRWPRLSYHDHLRYFTSRNPGTKFDWLRRIINSSKTKPKDVRWGADAPSADWYRYGRPFEPYPELGSRAGLLPIGGNAPTWLGDPTWTSERHYASEDSVVLITTLTRSADGRIPALQIEVTDWVDDNQDLLVRVHQVAPGVERFFYHTTFAPWLGRIKSTYDPLSAGFAALYCPNDDLIVHFRPRTPDARPLTKQPADGWTPEEIDARYPGGGMFVAWGFLNESDGVQIGADRAGRRVPADAPQGGRADAKDGQLQGNTIFLGPVDAALSRNFGGREGQVVVFIVAANSATNAAKKIRESRAAGLQALRERVDAGWKARSSKIYFPEEADPNVRRVAKRSLLSLLMGQDAESGAIVASLARQPCYHFDFPRDDAFFDTALDLAGFVERVDKHLAFLSKVQLHDQRAFSTLLLINGKWPLCRPEGHYLASYFTDGIKGIFPQPFEIDATGMTVWNFWRHEQFVPKERKAKYRELVGPPLQRGADAILRYVDLKARWMRPAFEDDNMKPTASLHGAASTLTGLMSAVAAGRSWGLDPDRVNAWAVGARELRQGILARIDAGLDVATIGWRGLHWSLWPAPIFEPSDSRVERLVERLLADITDKVEGRRAGFAYLGEQIFTLALAPGRDTEREAVIRRALNFLTNEVAFPGSEHFGEVALYGDFAGTGKKVYQNRTAIPHLWTCVLMYLTLMALHEPWRFETQRPPIPT